MFGMIWEIIGETLCAASHSMACCCFPRMFENVLSSAKLCADTRGFLLHELGETIVLNHCWVCFLQYGGISSSVGKARPVAEHCFFEDEEIILFRSHLNEINASSHIEILTVFPLFASVCFLALQGCSVFNHLARAYLEPFVVIVHFVWLIGLGIT